MNENYLDISSVSTTKIISKFKDGYNKLDAIKNRKLRGEFIALVSKIILILIAAEQPRK